MGRYVNATMLLHLVISRLIRIVQEITLDIIAGNPFNSNIFETKDGKFVLLSAVYVDLIYQWIAFLGCSIAVEDIRYAVKKWNATGNRMY